MNQYPIVNPLDPSLEQILQMTTKQYNITLSHGPSHRQQLGYVPHIVLRVEQNLLPK